MSDNIDRADQESDALILEGVYKKAPAGPQPTGECLWCGNTTQAFARWCDAQCRDDWEKHNKFSAQKPRK